MLPTASWSASFQTEDGGVKRLLDVGIALILLLLLSPVFLVVFLLIRCTSRGPVLYRQKRVGRDGQQFAIIKFRTMYHGADQNGPAVTATDDVRITPIGRKLRDNKLDELPQLFNVLRGDMSLVGPRPQVPRFVEHFDPALRAIALGVRPGITGPTALRFRHEETLLADKAEREAFYIQHILPVKLQMDAEYVMTRSLRGDARVLLETIRLFTFALFRRLFCIHPENPVKPLDVRANPYAPVAPWGISLEDLQDQYHAVTAETLTRKERAGNGHTGNGYDNGHSEGVHNTNGRSNPNYNTMGPGGNGHNGNGHHKNGHNGSGRAANSLTWQPESETREVRCESAEDAVRRS